MIYANDQWVQLPVRDLYNTNMMMLAISTAKEAYQLGLQLMKDFNKEYGDFLSPIQKDMDWYNTNITGKVRDTITSLYANGIDPLRSAEGRAIVSRLVNEIPIGKVNKLRQSAEIAKEFVKNRGILDAAGKYDPEQDAFLNNGFTLENWSTLDNGLWTRQAPSEYRTLQEYVHPSFKEIDPHMLSKEDVESRRYTYDPNYEYIGVTRSDMEKVMGSWMPGVRNQGLYKYYREQARQDLVRGGNTTPTEDEIDALFVKNAITADSQIMTPLKREANEFALKKYSADQQIRVAGAKEAISYKYDKKRAALGGGRGKGKHEDVPVIFREAAARPGQEVGYDILERPHYQWIDPMIQGARIRKGKQGNYAYNIPAAKVAQIYKKNDRKPDGSRISAQWDYGWNMSDATFIPTGQMRMETDIQGHPHFYITGTLQNNGTGREVQGIHGTELYEIEVTERAYNYGKKQATTYQPTN